MAKRNIVKIRAIILAAMAMLLQCAYAQRTMTGGNGVGKMSYFTCPSMGEMRFPVIIVEYQDVGIADTEENVMRHFDDFFNKEGFDYDGATGSVRDYFLAASAGRFSPRFDILGVVKLAQKRAYYGKGVSDVDGNTGDMVIEAVAAMAETTDFAVYDSNRDGEVDDVIVIYAGNAERFGAPSSAVLPTSYLIHFDKWGQAGFTYGYKIADELYANSYTITSELAWNCYDGIGTFLHEFSHALGMADQYNLYDTSSDYTPMTYDLMDIGLYNNNSHTPPTYSAFERYAMGWIDLEVIDGECELQLDYLGDTNKGYILPVTDTEFFVIENRQKRGWDRFIPSAGLKVWHIDYDEDLWYDNCANKDKSHQRIALENVSGPDYTFAPTWCGKDIGLTLTGIAMRDGRITASVADASAIMPTFVSNTAIRVSGRTVAAEADIRVRNVAGCIVGAGNQVVVPVAGIYIVECGATRTMIFVK